MRGALKGCVDRIVGDKAPAHHRVGAALLFESLIHDIDAVRGVLGDPEGVVSRARLARRSRPDVALAVRR